MTSPRFQKCLDARKAFVFHTGFCTSQPDDSEKTGPTSRLLLFNDHIKVRVSGRGNRETGSYTMISTQVGRHDPVCSAINRTFIAFFGNVWGLGIIFWYSLGGVPRHPRDTAAHLTDERGISHSLHFRNYFRCSERFGIPPSCIIFTLDRAPGLRGLFEK